MKIAKNSVVSPKAALIGLVAASVLALPGCASMGGRGGGATETAYVARDVETLYNAAKERLDRGDTAIAAALFDEVERQHPYSPWARRAQLMSAFAYYSRKQYNQAIQSASRFLSIHPGNRDAPYAYYLIAMCYYEQISDVERDQAITLQAQRALNEVIRRYPASQYASDARLKLDLVNDHLAGKEMEIGRAYERAGHWLAAQLRFRRVIDSYQTTSHAPEALYRLTETSLALGIPEEAQRYAAVLGANYPGNDWYARAYALIARHGPAVGLPAVAAAR
ncbi:outer membrane protein assembly factor BamD [Altererythrobacter lauratis]|uniref:Outer membrane protein assembly factor BamD n=1 Tax=Alteraurantiacibacter lauratis TaxID=2054627 RepID=A0ABV7EGS0_9SPHN